LPFTGSDDDKQRIITKVIANLQKHTGDELKRELETAVRLTHDDDAIVSYAHTLCDKLSDISGYHGANDVQLPAIAKLPPLLAVCDHTPDLRAAIESAVRVTNDNDFAVECGHAAAAIISTAIETGSVEAALKSGCEPEQNTISPLMANAVNRTGEDSIAVVADIGMSCNLEFGMPGAAHILKTTSSFTQAINTNILAGGDSCGRAILLGAVAGTAYGCNNDIGIPQQWITRLSQLTEVNQLLESLNL
jgi:ADP-ribosylglycohydrolase